MKKIMIAGTSSGSGKTTITLGLLKALIDRGLKVQPYKVGPDYVDTEYHTRVTELASRNLDMFLVQEKETLNQLFKKEAHLADIAVIEGVMGLFDGFGISKDYCSSAGVAKQLACPVLLVVDGKSASTSVAAVVKGFLEFDSDLDILGVIVNNVASLNHYQLIKTAIETYTTAKVFGYLKKDTSLSLPSRQLGLVPDRELADVLDKISLVATRLEETVDLDGILDSLQDEVVIYEEPIYPDFSEITVAYANDAAFHFYYPDNLELLKKYGIKLREFSPLKDITLPEADLYYLGGGYPEEFAKELADNQAIREQLLKKHEAGAFILAECGGLMYLGRSLEVAEKSYPMVGVFDGISHMTDRLKRFGYCYGVLEEDTLLGQTGDKLYGHEFHHSVFETSEPTSMEMIKKRDNQQIATWRGGYHKKNTFASYLHLHFYQQPYFVENMLQTIQKERKQ